MQSDTLCLARHVLLWPLGLLLLGSPLAAQSASRQQVSDARVGEVSADEAQGKATVKGRVFGDSLPLAAAKVYAYEVATYVMRKVATDRNGRFLFSSLPAGMYQIVAYKDGFAPSVELLLRRDPDKHQFVELRMEEDETEDPRRAETYWDVRGRIPSDVLQDIESQYDLQESALLPGVRLEGTSVLAAEMVADGGVESLGTQGEAQRTGAEVSVRGQVGDVGIDLAGSFQQISQQDGSLPEAQTQTVALGLEGLGSSRLEVSAASGEISASTGETAPEAVDLEHYQLSWSTKTGARGRSGLSASYTDENNFYQAGALAPAEIPETSRTLDIEGFYKGQLSPRTSLEAGLAYRQQSAQGFDLGTATKTGFFEPQLLDDEVLGLYGVAGAQIQPRVLVEIGLYSSVRDGSMSLTPHGSLVVQLGDEWKARTSVSRRVEEENDSELQPRHFNSSFFGDRDSCRQAGDACYEVTLTRSEGSQNEITLGAVHRQFAETLRLYFSPDFFNRLESVFVVEGDSLPEVEFSVVRKVTPRILARLQSNIAAGGGGIFYATDDQAYENQVRYLVTSLDTRFQSTSTGIFIAFHHLEQAFNPVDRTKGTPAFNEVEMQRLQLMLTQDLSILADVASNWAVRFNLELSRGSTPYTLTPDDELHKKLTGGISVSF